MAATPQNLERTAGPPPPGVPRYPSGLARVRTAWPQAVLVAISLAFLAVVRAVDYLTGFNLSFAVFYLLDVGFAAWLIQCW